MTTYLKHDLVSITCAYLLAITSSLLYLEYTCQGFGCMFIPFVIVWYSIFLGLLLFLPIYLIVRRQDKVTKFLYYLVGIMILAAVIGHWLRPLFRLS